VFTYEQLASSLQATTLTIQSFEDPHYGCRAAHTNIWTQLQEDPVSNEHLSIQSDSNGPLTPMAYFVIWVRFISQILITFDFVFSNIHMITPGRTFQSNKTLHKSTTLFLAWTSHSCQGLLEVMYHLFPSQTVCHKPYGFLKQFPIPRDLGNSISMEFIEKLPLP